MRPSNNLKNKIPPDIVGSSASVDESLDIQLFQTTTGIQLGPDVFAKSRLVLTFQPIRKLQEYCAAWD